MLPSLPPQLRQAIADRIRFYRELGIYDFYRRETEVLANPEDQSQPEQRESMSPRKSALAVSPATAESIFEVVDRRPEHGVSDPAQALKMIRADLGDCTRCPLHRQGRKQI